MKIHLTLLLLAVPSVCAAESFSDHTRPNPMMTPGAVRTVSVQEICTVRTSKVRNVPYSEKIQVYAEYGLPKNHTGYCSGPEGCEVDHLVSLELGGSNDIKNLWPEPYDGPWNAHVKDRIENELHRQVCAGQLTPEQAQTMIAKDWIGAYRRIFGSY